MDPLARRVPALKHRNRKPLSQEIRSVYKLLSVTLMVLAVTTTATYLYVNSLKPAKGYTLKQLELDYQALESEKRKLERQVIEAGALTNLEENKSLEEMSSPEDGNLTFVDEDNIAQKE